MEQQRMGNQLQVQKNNTVKGWFYLNPKHHLPRQPYTVTGLSNMDYDVTSVDLTTEVEPKVSGMNDPSRNRTNEAFSPFFTHLCNRKTAMPLMELPEDLLRRIIHTTIGDDSTTLDRLAPMMAVSSGLRNFIQAIQGFWNVVGSRRPYLIRCALKWSGDLPLKICLDARNFSPEPSHLAEQVLHVRRALNPQSHRITILSFTDFTSSTVDCLTEGLAAPDLHTFNVSQKPTEGVPLGYSLPVTLRILALVGFTLRQTAITQSNLRSLRLVSTSFGPTLGLAALLDALRNSPGLEVLSMESILGLESNGPEAPMVVELPELWSLSLSRIRVGVFKTLCGALCVPSLQTAKIRLIRAAGNDVDEPWLNSILDRGEPSSDFIRRWLQQPSEITLVLCSNTHSATDFDTFDGPGFYLHIGGIQPGITLRKLKASYPLESINAPITLGLAGPAPDPQDAELCRFDPSSLRLPALHRLVLQTDYIARDALPHLSAIEPVPGGGVYPWPCPKLKALSLPASTAVEGTFVLDCIGRRYAVAHAHASALSEPQQIERLGWISIVGQVGEESTWDTFIDKVASFTNTNPRLRVRHVKGPGAPGAKQDNKRPFTYDLVPLEAPSPGWYQISRLGMSPKAVSAGG
ncbi:hypothetical protein FRB94_009749 [Tulasnella sp. JGI-2019a]|nr:hypothetical protein FRB94_009749 [Tulasnella sp. JGI-2019a]